MLQTDYDKLYSSWFTKQLNAIGEWAWTDTMVDVFLVSDHPAIALEKATFFFTTIDIDMLREGNLVKLFEAGYNSPMKIMKMEESQLRYVLGENGSKIYHDMVKKLQNLEKYNLMAATGYFGRGVGRKKLKKLLEASLGGEDIFTNYSWIVTVEGFQAKTANRVISGYKQYHDFVAELGDYINFKEFAVAGTSGELSGQIYVFTGIRDKDLENKLVAKGGTIGDNFTSKTTCVVAKNPNEDSGKLKKAREKGIKIVGYQQLKEEME